MLYISLSQIIWVLLYFPILTLSENDGSFKMNCQENCSTSENYLENFDFCQTNCTDSSMCSTVCKDIQDFERLPQICSNECKASVHALCKSECKTEQDLISNYFCEEFCDQFKTEICKNKCNTLTNILEINNELCMRYCKEYPPTICNNYCIEPSNYIKNIEMCLNGCELSILNFCNNSCDTYEKYFQNAKYCEEDCFDVRESLCDGCTKKDLFSLHFDFCIAYCYFFPEEICSAKCDVKENILLNEEMCGKGCRGVFRGLCTTECPKNGTIDDENKTFCTYCTSTFSKQPKIRPKSLVSVLG